MRKDVFLFVLDNAEKTDQNDSMISVVAPGAATVTASAMENNTPSLRSSTSLKLSDCLIKTLGAVTSLHCCYSNGLTEISIEFILRAEEVCKR